MCECILVYMGSCVFVCGPNESKWTKQLELSAYDPTKHLHTVQQPPSARTGSGGGAAAVKGPSLSEVWTSGRQG